MSNLHRKCVIQVQNKILLHSLRHFESDICIGALAYNASEI
jgi:hypothetical protein